MHSAKLEKRRMEAVLGRHGVRLSKRFGQNFLTDAGVLQRIVDAAQIEKDDFVLEIGPGMGSLTRLLSKSAARVLAIEIDERLMPVLEEELADCFNIELVQGDVMKLDLSKLISKDNEGRTIRIVANLPYYITTPILMKILEGDLNWSRITVMVQREVAERMIAEPGSKAYGALSLSVAYRAKPEVAFFLPPEAFFPPPKVESAVVSMQRFEQPPVAVEDENLLFLLIRAAFNQRRKTLVNALYNGANLSLSKEEIENSVFEAGFTTNIRGEKLSLADFVRLADVFSN